MRHRLSRSLPLLFEGEFEDRAARDRALETQSSFIVQAPAGSGKTELLTQRFLRLLSVVDEPEKILAITFTRAATAEMRNRVLDALKSAKKDPANAGAPARAALQNDALRGWKLLEQPQRLTIQTIDSLCLTIAHETPLLSRLGGSLTPIEHAEPLYALAARRTLCRLGGTHSQLSIAIQSVLELRETSLADCERLIAGMLAQRDQWGRVLYAGQEQEPGLDAESNWQSVQKKLAEPFAREHQRVIQRARRLFAARPKATAELLQLLKYACGNLTSEGRGREILHLKGITEVEQLVDKRHWDCVCEFLLTVGNKWRAAADKNNGFPPGRPGDFAKQQKKRFEDLIEDLERDPQLLPLLCELRRLPPTHYSAEQWTLLRHVLLLLRYATAELRVIFAEKNVVDFVELGLAAGQVLRNDTESLPRDLVRRWPHLLVDEFQDTSRGQYNLLSLLAEAWETAGTCFLVGDPMQSIYSFRQAEVELFERTRRHGLGEGPAKVSLQPLELQMNFRSHAGLVDTLNNFFKSVFAPLPGASGYHVSFAPSVASAAAPSGVEGVRVIPRLLHENASEEERLACRRAEADEVVRIIRRHWPEVQAAEQEQRPCRVAVLVRAKNHLTEIAHRLRYEGIPFRAIEIEELGKRQEVLDLTALVRALLQPLDRIAWLSVLRAPWCGLRLPDLHILCGSDDPALYKRPVLELLRMRIPLLSLDGQARASRVAAVLEDALRGKHRQASFSHWVERVWQTLGGRECVDRSGFENARSFFRMLEELPPDGAELEEQLDGLFAEPDPRASEQNGVQLMTIHKAKGLGFDIVIVPGLERQTSKDRQSLLAWLERTTLEGAAEEERQEFLVAPIGRKGDDSDPLYRWIGRQKASKQAEEAKRLLYVACTRASRELHLLGTATVKTEQDGTKTIKPGNGDNLLKTGWPALEKVFLDRWEEQRNGWEARQQPLSPSAPAQPGLASDARTDLAQAKTLQLRRLPADWDFSTFAKSFADPVATLLPNDQGLGAEFETPDVPGIRSPGSLKARAVGVVVHALLEELTHRCSSDPEMGNPAALLKEVDAWRHRAMTMLRQAGLPRAEAEAQSAKVIHALTSTLEDEQGRWILTARHEARTEASWSTWLESEDAAGSLSTLRGDRVFRAGAEPGFPGHTHMWIVDYKTAHHGRTDLEAFLAQEKQQYRKQLETYGRIMRQLHGETLPLRLALYYPLLQKLLWWEG